MKQKFIKVPEKSFETIFAYFDHLQKRGQESVGMFDIYRMFHFLKQVSEENKEIIGIAFKRFDGIEFKDTPTSDMYEGGFATNKIEPEDSDLDDKMKKSHSELFRTLMRINNTQKIPELDQIIIRAKSINHLFDTGEYKIVRSDGEN